MKNISSAIFYMSEWQAIFQQEYSYSEARPFQDKQKNMIGLVSYRSGSLGLYQDSPI